LPPPAAASFFRRATEANGALDRFGRGVTTSLSTGSAARARCTPCRQLEHAHRLGKLARLLLQALGCRSRFFNNAAFCWVNVVHLADGLVNLLDAGALFLARRGYLAHDVGDALDRGNDLAMVLPASSTSSLPASTLPDGVFDQGLDFLGRTGAALGEVANFGATTAKPRPLSPARAASTRGVQRKNVGLKGMPSMTPMMSAIFARALLDRGHGVDNLADNLARP